MQHLNNTTNAAMLSIDSSATTVTTVNNITAPKFIGDGSELTNIVAGSGVIVNDSGSLVGTAGTINFDAGIDVSMSMMTVLPLFKHLVLLLQAYCIYEAIVSWYCNLCNSLQVLHIYRQPMLPLHLLLISLP